MSESAERIAASEEHASKPCGWCQERLEPGAPAAVCTECAAAHHEACWDRELGCSAAGCFNAPLARLDAADEPRAPAPQAAAPVRRRRRRAPEVRSDLGSKGCVDCGQRIAEECEICPTCFAINTPDGLYHGPTTTFSGARDALLIAIAGLVVCGPLLGPLAIQKASAAKVAIKRDPRLSGEGLATAATIIGVVDLLFWFIALITRTGGL